MAGLVDTTSLGDLTPVAAEARATEGDPRPVYTWEGPPGTKKSMVRSYLPSDGGAPRLVAAGEGSDGALCVWDTGTGALLEALQGPGPQRVCRCLVTYQRASDGRPKVAAGSDGGLVFIWDGDDLQVLHALMASADARLVTCLAVYEEPISGSTRLVTGYRVSRHDDGQPWRWCPP
jgi:WD40 repeat protein